MVVLNAHERKRKTSTSTNTYCSKTVDIYIICYVKGHQPPKLVETLHLSSSSNVQNSLALASHPKHRHRRKGCARINTFKHFRIKHFRFKHFRETQLPSHRLRTTQQLAEVALKLLSGGSGASEEVVVRKVFTMWSKPLLTISNPLSGLISGFRPLSLENPLL